MNNKMKQIAELLGVELYEEFNVGYLGGKVSNGKYRLSERGLEYNCVDEWSISENDLGGFFTGQLRIIKQPWKPKVGELYFMPTLRGYSDRYYWSGGTSEDGLYENGLVFKTKEEAEEMSRKILEFARKERGIEEGK